MSSYHRHYLSIGMLLAASVTLLVCWIVFRQGITGPLLLDGWSNLDPIRFRSIESLDSLLFFVFGNTSGPSGRPLSMLFFLIDGQNWNADIAALKASNIILHLLCGVVLFGFVASILSCCKLNRNKTLFLSFVSTSIWLLHPLNVSTVLYVIQRMTELVFLFSLIALVFFIHGRKLLNAKPKIAMCFLLLCLFPFGFFAVMSKENGVLLLLAIVIIEKTLFADSPTTLAYKRWIHIGVVAPLLIVISYLAFTFESMLAAYEFRPFSMFERILTEARILFVYLFNIFLPQVDQFGLHHDDFQISTGLLSPLTSIISLIALAALLLSALRIRQREPMFAFAVFWFFGWHILESTYIPLELYFEHRNYLPMVGPILAFSFYVSRFVDAINLKLVQRVALVSSVVVIVIFASLTARQTQQWGMTGALITHWAETSPESRRAQSNLAAVYAEIGNPRLGLQTLHRVREYYPSELTLLLEVWNYSCTHNLSYPLEISQIAQLQDLEYYRDDVGVQLQLLVDNLSNQACNYPSRDEMILFMSKVDSLPMESRDKAAFHALYSEMLVHYELIDEALAEIDKSIALEPSVDLAIRQSTLAGSRGRFADALDILEKAYEVDANRRIPLPSRLDEINDLKQRLQLLLEQAS